MFIENMADNVYVMFLSLRWLCEKILLNVTVWWM